MQIHEIIRTRRTALGLTQEQLAGKLGTAGIDQHIHYKIRIIFLTLL